MPLMHPKHMCALFEHKNYSAHMVLPVSGLQESIFVKGYRYAGIALAQILDTVLNRNRQVYF